MTILHKCSKTHGHYWVLLVTSWLRRKAEKCDRICRGLWCLPAAQARAARHSCEDQALSSPARVGLGISPTPRALVQGPPLQVGRPLTLLWGGVGTAPAPVRAASFGMTCCLEPVPCPLLQVPAKLPVCLSRRPLPWMVSGDGDVQDWARNCQQVCTWVPEDR